MPLPLIIGGLAAVAGVTGVGFGIHGGVKMKEANDTMNSAQCKQEKAVHLFEKRNSETTKFMDSIGKKELEILSTFDEFSNIIEKIQGRPDFKSYKRNGIKLPDYEAEELRKVSAGAGVLLGGIGGAAVGTAGGFAAAGATTSAVMAFGISSTGTAISTLSGAAATNATLAALGGGSIAAGGGGMALGSVVLGGATLGVGLLVGGIIFSVTGSTLSDKANAAYNQAKRTEKDVNRIVKYFNELNSAATPFKKSLIEIEKQYKKRLSTLNEIVNISKKTQWSEFTDQEKKMTENTVLLVGILYKMCKINLVSKNQNIDGLNSVNREEINIVIDEANRIYDEVNKAA
jgi:hypothetical protein